MLKSNVLSVAVLMNRINAVEVCDATKDAIKYLSPAQKNKKKADL